MTGIENFSGFEVIRAAMEIEKKGHHFYAAMAQKGKNELAREVFAWMAQDEIGHLRTLENLMPRYEEGAFWEEEESFLPYLRQLAGEEFFPSAERIEEIVLLPDADRLSLDLAIAAEEKFADYFHRAAQGARNADGREAFAWLAAEETRHAGVLRDRREKLLQGR